MLAAPLTPSLSSCTQVQDPKLHFCPGTVNARAANATDFFSPAQNGACASIVSFLADSRAPCQDKNETAHRSKYSLLPASLQLEAGQGRGMPCSV